MLKKNPSRSTVAILGAGIMGSSVALYLAKKRIKAVLIDAAPHPFTGASRWNEGKIHLGYLYGADPSLKTARTLIPGGVNFPVLVKELVGRELDGIVTASDDRYLIHKNSVADPKHAFDLAKKISQLSREHPDAKNYFVSLIDSPPRPLTASELENQYNTEVILSAFEVPERSVSTQHVADYYVDALYSCSQIECRMGQRVLAVAQSGGRKDTWTVETVDSSGAHHVSGPFDAVVNALWEGRGAVDASAGLKGPDTWTHRYRVAVFARTGKPVDVKSAVIAVGPFGDIKNYDGRNLYISWYPSGLLAESQDVQPPPVTKPDKGEERRIVKDTLNNLGAIIPEVRGVLENCESCQVQGGWVYAAGQGALSDPRSDLHKRDKIGLFSRQSYFSIDTGKFSIAPWLARKVADAVLETVN